MIKATIRKFWELSWASRTKLKAFMKNATPFNSFASETFNSPTLQIAEATDEHGEPLIFCPVEQVLMVSAYAVSPIATKAEAKAAGDLIDYEIERLGQNSGIDKCLLMLPADSPNLPEGEWKMMHVYERKIPLSISGGGVGLHNPTSRPVYIN